MPQIFEEEETEGTFNTKGLALRAAQLIEEFKVHIRHDPKIREKDHLKILRNRAAVFNNWKLIIYKTGGDFIDVCDQLCEKLGQPKLFPILSEKPEADLSEKPTIEDFFDALEENGVTVTQAAVLGIMLGYNPEQLEQQAQKSGESLPFSIKEVRKSWEEIVTTRYPVIDKGPMRNKDIDKQLTMGKRLQYPSLSETKLDPALAHALDPSHEAEPSHEATLAFPGSSSESLIFSAKTSEDFQPQILLKAGMEVLAIAQERTIKQLVEFVGETQTGVNKAITKEENARETRDSFVGVAATTLLQHLASNYRNQTEVGNRNEGEEIQALAATLSAAAGKDEKAKDEAGNPIKNKYYFDKETLVDILNGNHSLDASEWKSNIEPLRKMLKVLLGNHPDSQIEPFINFMSGEGLIDIPGNGHEAAEAVSDHGEGDHKASKYANKPKSENSRMIKEQRKAIAEAEKEMKECLPGPTGHNNAATIATELFNNLININTSLSRMNNLEVATVLARQVFGTSVTPTYAGGDEQIIKIKKLAKIIEGIRHGDPFNASSIDAFGSNALDRIVTRMLMRDIRNTKSSVIKLLTHNQERSFFNLSSVAHEELPEDQDTHVAAVTADGDAGQPFGARVHRGGGRTRAG